MDSIEKGKSILALYVLSKHTMLRLSAQDPIKSLPMPGLKNKKNKNSLMTNSRMLLLISES